MLVDEISLVFEAAPSVIKSVCHFLNVESAWPISRTFAGNYMEFSFGKFRLLLFEENSLADLK